MPATEKRLAQLEAAEEIGQIVARYAAAYDAGDLATLEALHAPSGRAAAMAALAAEMPAGVTFHLMAEPALEFDSPDEAHALVVCRVESEVGDEWIVAGLTYEDRYTREAGRWYLAERRVHTTYSGDVLSRPA